MKSKLQAKSYLSLKTEKSRPLSVSQTRPQVQGNWVKDRAIQALRTLMSPFGKAANQVVEILQNVAAIVDADGHTLLL